MRFSTFYHLQTRYVFFERFFKRESAKFKADIIPYIKQNYEDTMEIITGHIINEDAESLKLLLTRTNSKVARTFFDYITGLETSKMKRDDVVKIIENFFSTGEKIMKGIDEYLKENVKEVNFDKILKTNGVKLTLNEAEADDESDDDLDFGSDDDNGSDDGDGNTSLDADSKPIEHESDPDFTDGIRGDSVVLNDVPAGETIYDAEGVMNALKAVVETIPQEKLIEIERVKNCLELIFSGKKLVPEDLEFENIQNAIYIISKVQEQLDDATNNYMRVKLKEPLALKRDQLKVDIGTMQLDINKSRDIILGIDKLNRVKGKTKNEE